MSDETKKKVIIENSHVEAQGLQVDGLPTERAEQPAAIQAPKAEVAAPEQGMSQMHRNLLVGATPLLFGILSGNTVEGAQVAGDNLQKEDQIARDQQTKNAKGTLEQRLAQMRLERELAKTATEKEKQRTKGMKGSLEDKHVVEVEDPETGKPIIMTNDEAVQLKANAWKQSAKDDFHLEEKKELEKFKAGLEKEKPLDKYKSAKDENELYRMYSKDSDTTKKMGEAYTRFQGSMTRPSSTANDLAVIFNFMKILDPTSVVREGEQASAANATSVPDAIRTHYNRLLLGKDQKLPEGLREKFFNEASAMYKQQLASQASIDEHFKGIAGRRGLDSKNIVRSFPKATTVQEKTTKSSVIPSTAKTWVNAEGKALVIDMAKLTPRGRKELEQDGYKLQGTK